MLTPDTRIRRYISFRYTYEVSVGEILDLISIFVPQSIEYLHLGKL